MKIIAKSVSFWLFLAAIALSGHSVYSQTTVGPFSFYPTNLGGTMLGQAQINSIPCAAGDIVAAFDPSGECVGAKLVIINSGIAYINMVIYGDDGGGHGMSPGELFYLKIFDESAGQVIEYGSVLSGWQNTSFAPMPGYNNVNAVFNFIPLGPMIEVSPDTMQQSLFNGQTSIQEMVIKNTGDAPLEYVISVLVPEYCSASTNTQDEYIANVLFGTINNNSGWQGGVADYTAISTVVNAGDSQVITVTNGNAWPEDMVSCWFDWNMNGEFEEGTDEKYQLTNVGNIGQTFTGVIAIPAETPVGKYRMRIRMVYVNYNNPPPFPCGNSNYGEVEDYTLVVGNNSWLNVVPISGILLPGQQEAVSVAFIPIGLEYGIHQADIVITSNDANNPTLFVPVELNVLVSLTANFGANPTIGELPLTVQFSDSTVGFNPPTSWAWDFENDGIIDSYEQNPLYTYNERGTYSVSLIVSNGTETDTLVKDNFIKVFSAPSIEVSPLSFTYQAVAGEIIVDSLNIKNLGDDTLVYSIEVDYLEKLNAELNRNSKQMLCIDNLYSTGCIYGRQIKSWSLSNINIPEIPCSGSPSWYHDFTDRTHELIAGQTYQLKLSAGDYGTHFSIWIDFNGNNELSQDELIFSGICELPNLLYNFEIEIPSNIPSGSFVMRARTNSYNPATDPCINYSYGNCCDFTVKIINSNWLFVNSTSGNLNSNEEKNHLISIYPPFETGALTANLKITSNDPNNPIFNIPVEINIYVPLTAQFDADITSGEVPFTVQFTDKTAANNPPTSWAWDFQNDGIIDSYVQNPEWTYNNIGSFSVKLTVSNDNETSELTKENYIEVFAGDYDGPIWHVSTTGNDTYGNGSEAFPFATIQNAINKSSNGHTVLVAPGTYYEQINFIGKNITVASHFIMDNDPATIEQTIINANGGGSAVRIQNNETSEAKIIGFTITGTISADDEGAITITNASPTVMHSVISNNTSDQNGAGICLQNSGAIVSFNKINNNSAGGSAGVSIRMSSDAVILHNQIINNTADGTAGLYIEKCNPLISHNLIAGNVSAQGVGGVRCYDNAFPTFVNNTIVDNSGYIAGGLRLGTNCDPTLINNIFWGNSATVGGDQVFMEDGSSDPNFYFNNIEGGLEGFGLAPNVSFVGAYENNMNEDPLFADPENGIFTLTEDSPCIDSGDPSQPDDPDFTPCDMGYQYFHQDFVAFFEADQNWVFPPYEVNFNDLSTGNPTAWAWDLNGDGSIDSYEQNPSLSYTEFGWYSVSLTTSNSENNYTRTRTNYIRVDYTKKPVITAIEDVPNDQGGKVYVHFSRSTYDNDSLQKWGSMYNVQMNTGSGWFNTATVGAYGDNYYTVMCTTPFDSTQYSNGLINFRVIAIMQEGNFASALAQGYSVDNLAPAIPSNMNFEMLANEIIINWNPSPDQDFAHFAVYKSDTSGEYPSTPVAYTILPSFTDQLISGETSFYVITALDYSGNESGHSEEVETLPTMRWELTEGWSGISSFIEPADTDIENMFDAIQSQLIILQNNIGMYWPGQNVNTLGSWSSESGYKIKVSEDVSMTIMGSRLLNQSLEMNDVWNLFPVLSGCPVNVEGLFAGKDVIIVKEVAGYLIFWPQYGINTLGELEPGKAYFALMGSEEEITFPACEGLKASASERLSDFRNLSGLVPWLVSKPSSITHTIALPESSVRGNSIAPGNIIGVFDLAGNCHGLVEWQGLTTAITAFGNDPLSGVKDGFDLGEIMNFRAFNPEKNTVSMLELEYNLSMPQKDEFVENGLSAITNLKTESSGITGFGYESYDIQIVPNPASDAFTLYLSVQPKSEATLLFFNLEGQIIKKVIISEKVTKISIDNLASGVYIVSVNVDNQTFTRRLIKE